MAMAAYFYDVRELFFSFLGHFYTFLDLEVGDDWFFVMNGDDRRFFGS